MAEKNTGSARDRVKGLAQIEREQRRKSIAIWSLVGVIIASLIAVGVVIAVKSSGSEGGGGTPKAAQDKTPKNITSEGSFQLSKNGAVNTNPKAAGEGVRTQVVFDPMCPGCAAFDREMSGNLLEKAKKGEIDLNLSPVAFLNRASTDQYSTRAANAFVTVAEEDPEHAYAFMTAIYDAKNQPNEGQAYRPVTDEKLAEIAKKVGVKESAANNFKNHYYTKWVDKRTNDLNTARKDLFTDGISTPAVFVGGKTSGDKTEGAERVDFQQADSFTSAVEAALAKAKK